MCVVHRLLALSYILAVVTSTLGAAEGVDYSTHGLQILTKVVKQYLNNQADDLKISEGVHLISTPNANDARAHVGDSSVIDLLENYLKSHEIRIKLPELMPQEGFGRALKNAMDGFESNEIGTPRKGGGGLGGGGGKKGDGGLGAVALMGLMMGKMMAALGLGGVGLLAMKALMVSAMALMLSMIVGLKKLVSSDSGDSGHTVIHASPSHGYGGGYEHRRKRAADIAYHAWSDYKSS
ncbi:hypothetical protein Trydic_g23086 [Trypoxylus dichotomus]